MAVFITCELNTAGDAMGTVRSLRPITWLRVQFQGVEPQNWIITPWSRSCYVAVSCELISVSIVKWCYIATEAMFGHSLNNTDHGVAVDFKITFTGWLQRDGHHSLIQITISRMKLRKKKYAPHNGCWTHLAGGEGRSLDAVVSLSQ